MKIKIYQINRERDENDVKFRGLEKLDKWQGTKEIDPAIYDEVFSGEVDCSDLETLYAKFQDEGMHLLHRGHSLSVSDVVVKEDGAFYCDLIGFSKINFEESKTHKPDNLMTVVFVEPNRLPYVAEIENTLEGMQRVVGGKIQCIDNDDDTLIVCNNEAKLQRMEPNRMLSDYDIISGNFFIAGSAGTEMRSLSQEEQEKYIQKYGGESLDKVANSILDVLLKVMQ